MKTRIVLASLAALTLFACTKERPYKIVGKPDIGTTEFPTSSILKNTDYIMTVQTLEGARYASGYHPHYSPDAKTVQLELRENAFIALERDEDERWSGNPTNSKIVTSIPVEYIAYRCTVDDYGKCTNKEEENKDIPWYQKNWMRLKPQELAMQQLPMLPLEIKNFFYKCADEVSSEMIHSEVTPNAINFILEKTFHTREKCVEDRHSETLDNNSFSVRYQYSFIKKDTMVGIPASPNYQPAEYTRTDEFTFGFFDVRKIRYDIDNNDVVSSEKQFIQRWNPKRSLVTYYLSSGFSKPENASIRKATYDAFDVLNGGLKSAGVNFRLELKDPVPGMSSGDARNSMVVLEEDPTQAGLLGYGPQVSDSRTGEILSAKVVMYSGAMKQEIGTAYDYIVKDRIARGKGKGLKAPVVTAPDGDQTAGSGLKLNQDRAIQMQKVADSLKSVIKEQGPNQTELKQNQVIDRAIPMNELNVGFISPVSSQTQGLMSGSVSSSIANNDQASSPAPSATDLRKAALDKINFMSKNCMYTADMMNFDAAIVDGVDQVIEKVGLKPWVELTDPERQLVISALLPYVWTPTLIHEMGHNLGLRHNFAGSTDKPNFYTPKELAAMGVKHPWVYSSVMDYSYRVNNELRVLGKYDIAALRFGYKQELDLKDGTVVSVADFHKNPKLDIKPYSYCTDEFVDVNANCGRFDEGTSLTLMANHYVEAYNENYNTSNFRNNRRIFSQMDDSVKADRLERPFMKLRMMFEKYESVKNMFSLPDDSNLWNTEPFLKDIKQATMIAGKFFLDVLKTPDILCAVTNKDKPTEVFPIPLLQLSTRAISCFDKDNVRVQDGYSIVGQTGRPFLSKKDPHSDNPYLDQIDIRGIYIDKLMALRYLTKREFDNNIFDQYTENFLQFSPLADQITTTLNSFLLDNLSGNLDFTGPTGEKFTLTVPYRFYDSSDAQNSHRIPALMDADARTLFELPDKATDFHVVFLRDFLRNMQSKPHHDIASNVTNLFQVRTELPLGNDAKEYGALKVGSQAYYVHPSSQFSLEMAQGFTVSTILGGLKQEQMKAVAQSLIKDEENAAKQEADRTTEQSKEDKPVVAAPVPEDTSLDDQEKAAKALGKDYFEAFLNGQFQSPSYYSLILETLADETIAVQSDWILDKIVQQTRDQKKD